MATNIALPNLRRWAERALGAVLPARCLGCGLVVERPGALCPACWRGIDFLAPPLCACCGMPFELDPGEGARCGACLAQPPSFGRARAVFRYSEASRALILGFKHGDRLHGTRAFAAWMARAGAELIADASLIVPVPLHWTRLFMRRYNQAALLANALAAASGVPAIPDLLIRKRRTPSQGRLNRTERRRNVHGAFVPLRRAARRLEGASVLLVDDVFTTGATVEACAKALLAGGAARVDVLTLARVVRAHALG